MPDSELARAVFQIGKQTAFDSVVAPTAILHGLEELNIKPLIDAEAFPEQRGDYSPSYLAAVNRKSAEWSISGTPVYEDICYFLDMLFGEATPTGSGPYVYGYSAPLSSKPSVRISTLLKAIEEGAYGVTGAIANTFELNLEPNARPTFSCGGPAYVFDTDTEESLSFRTVNPMHANQAQIYIDDWGGTAGTTEYVGCKLSYALSLDLARSVKECIGSYSPVDWRHGKPEAGSNQLTIGLEFNSASGLSKDMLDELIAVTTTPFRKIVRLKLTSGTNIFQCDFAGFAESAPDDPFIDSDGIATVEFTLSGMYESTLGNWFEAEVTNGLSVLP